MPKNGNDNSSDVVKQFSLTNVDNPHASDVNFTNTTIAFNIEENRRRRAELAKDVSELINFSKFFQQSYTNAYDTGDANDFPLVRKSVDRKNRMSKNAKLMPTKLSKSSSCITKYVRGIAGKVSQTKLNNAAGASVYNNNNAVVTLAEQSHQGGDLPPVFDQEKLNEYCVGIVQEYFKKSKSTDVSVHNIKTKTKSTELVRQSGFNESKIVERVTHRTRNESNKYASVSARYLSKCSNRKDDEQPAKTVRNSWISARSIAILENANRNGAEVKKHNCVAQETKNGRALGSAKKKVQMKRNRSLENFHRFHPSIDLIASATIFPRRNVKVRDEDAVASDSCDSIAGTEDANSFQDHAAGVEAQSEVADLVDPTESNIEPQNSLVIRDENECAGAK